MMLTKQCLVKMALYPKYDIREPINRIDPETGELILFFPQCRVPRTCLGDKEQKWYYGGSDITGKTGDGTPILKFGYFHVPEEQLVEIKDERPSQLEKSIKEP